MNIKAAVFIVTLIFSLVPPAANAHGEWQSHSAFEMILHLLFGVDYIFLFFTIFIFMGSLFYFLTRIKNE